MDRIEQYIISKIHLFQKPFYLCIQGDSMFPSIKSGDKILVVPYANEMLAIGDIVVFRKFTDHLTVHRIVNRMMRNGVVVYYNTKGDNNITSDQYNVFPQEIIGIVK